jgi:hypothetical protein
MSYKHLVFHPKVDAIYDVLHMFVPRAVVTSRGPGAPIWVSVAADQCIRVWDGQDVKAVANVVTTAPLSCADFGADGNALFVGTLTGDVLQFDLRKLSATPVAQVAVFPQRSVRSVHAYAPADLVTPTGPIGMASSAPPVVPTSTIAAGQGADPVAVRTGGSWRPTSAAHDVSALLSPLPDPKARAAVDRDVATTASAAANLFSPTLLHEPRSLSPTVPFPFRPLATSVPGPLPDGGLRNFGAVPVPKALQHTGGVVDESTTNFLLSPLPVATQGSHQRPQPGAGGFDSDLSATGSKLSTAPSVRSSYSHLHSAAQPWPVEGAFTMSSTTTTNSTHGLRDPAGSQYNMSGLLSDSLLLSPAPRGDTQLAGGDHPLGPPVNLSFSISPGPTATAPPLQPPPPVSNASSASAPWPAPRDGTSARPTAAGTALPNAFAGPVATVAAGALAAGPTRAVVSPAAAKGAATTTATAAAALRPLDAGRSNNEGVTTATAATTAAAAATAAAAITGAQVDEARLRAIVREELQAFHDEHTLRQLRSMQLDLMTQFQFQQVNTINRKVLHVQFVFCFFIQRVAFVRVT